MNNKILIFGINGMLGHVLYTEFLKDPNVQVFGTVRQKNKLHFLEEEGLKNCIINIDAANITNIEKLFQKIKPDFVINCIGIIKQLKNANNPVEIIPINSLFPHQLDEICRKYNAKLIHISTDCVFNGKKGNYSDNELTDAEDLYGRTKALGEVDSKNSITIRTSIIGHEIETKFGLLEWFLSQTNSVKGFTNAIFSGFPTIEIYKIIANFVIPNNQLTGIINVASQPISKYDLLLIISEIYKHKIEIISSSELFINRSLNSSKFNSVSNYQSPNWDELVLKMYSHYLRSKFYKK